MPLPPGFYCLKPGVGGGGYEAKVFLYAGYEFHGGFNLASYSYCIKR